MLAIVAGSHTTSSSAGHALFYLLTHSDDMARLRAELDAAARAAAADNEKGEDVEGIPLDQLEKLPFLNAVMCVTFSCGTARMPLTTALRNETLRLRPSIPDGVPRTPPPEGGPMVVGSQCVLHSTCSSTELIRI
jgi:cytochrome P450